VKFDNKEKGAVDLAAIARGVDPVSADVKIGISPLSAKTF